MPPDPVEAQAGTPGHSSTAVETGEDEPLRSGARWGYGGCAVGIGLGAACTAAQVANAGYGGLPFILVWNLIWAPFLGIVVGRGLSRSRRQESPGSRLLQVCVFVLSAVLTATALRLGPFLFAFPWSLIWLSLVWIALLGVITSLARSGPRPEPLRKSKLPQLRVHTLVAIIAYLALLLGAAFSTLRIGTAASQYQQKSITSAEMARVHRKLERDCAADARLRRANVAELRAGRIPLGLLPSQREFLQSLDADPKVTADHRNYRRRLITESEETHRIRQEKNVVVTADIAKHFERLVAKYEWYRWHPWRPIDPDPSVPHQ